MARRTIPRPRPRRQPLAEAALETSRLTLGKERAIVGFVFDPAALDRRFSVEILLDGLVAATTYADLFVPELADRKIGDACYGFATYLGDSLLAAASTLEARVANLGQSVGQPIDLASPVQKLVDPRPTANIRWLGGLRFLGWIDEKTSLQLSAVVDGEVVAQVPATTWTRVDEDWEQKAGRDVRAFDFHLPDRFADGCAHTVRLRFDDGEMLPVATTFAAFPDGLAATLAALGNEGTEALRGELYDRLIPSSLPLNDYAAWRNRFPLPAPKPSQLRLAVAIIGTSGAEETLTTLEAQSHHHWTAGIIEGAPLTLDSGGLREFLAEEEVNVDAVVIAIAGTSFAEDALARIAAAFDQHEAARLIYGDLDFAAEDGMLWPLAFPAFDYERMLEQGYCAHLFALRRKPAMQALERHPENTYRLFNSLFETETAPADVLHLPGSLAILPRIDLSNASLLLASATETHLRKRGIASEVTAMQRSSILPSVRVRRTFASQQTTIVIPTRDKHALLKRCLESISAAVERSKADILIIDNDSTDADTLAYFGELNKQGVKTMRVEGPFNFARLNNRAAANVDADNLCLLNNDIEAIGDDWLEEMLARLSEPDVGAVGALLCFPGGVVQHGGVVLGPDFSAAHAFVDRLADDAGYINSLRVAHERSAVTAACLLVRRSDYLAVGGMDERLAVAFNDVDFCLKLREQGRRIVMTPHARLVHHESVSRGSDRAADRRFRFEREKSLLRARWGQFLLDDPTYNPQLSLDQITYAALAWPPRDRRPRSMARPNPRALPPGF